MDKYIIDGVEYSRGEEVEVSMDKENWEPVELVGFYKKDFVIITIDKNESYNSQYRYIRKIQPTQYEGSSGRFIYGEQSLLGRKAKLTIGDGTELNVTIE